MRHLSLVFALLFLCTACDEELGPGEFVNDPLLLTGQSSYNTEECGPDIYPCPPYGTRQYQTLRNIPFLPANPMADEIAGDDGIARLSYFYTLREQGYTLLLISETTEWCDVCEAQMATLPAMVDTYGVNATVPQVAFLTVVTEDDSLNSATLEVASNYSTDHDLDHVSPITNDENLYFRDLMTASSYPFNIFVDLANMEIIGYASGLETEVAFSTKLDEMLDFVAK